MSDFSSAAMAVRDGLRQLSAREAINTLEQCINEWPRNEARAIASEVSHRILEESK